MKAGLNLLRDIPVVISTSHCRGGFPRIEQYTFPSAWPRSQALSPATHTMMDENHHPLCIWQKLCYKLWNREIGPFEMYSYLHITQEVLPQGKGAPEAMGRDTNSPKGLRSQKICVFIPRTIIKHMARQERAVKDDQCTHKERRDGNDIPRAKDGANNCTQRDNDLWLFLFPASGLFLHPQASV